jgi:hypothetical protein
MVNNSTNKTDCHDITEILLKVALNTIKPNKISQIGIFNVVQRRGGRGGT